MQLPDDRVWLRVADPEWKNPLDPTYAQKKGGRWNPPASFATLYLNGDVITARSQLMRLLEGSPVQLEDLDDDAYVLVAATLPRNQVCADATTDTGLAALGLPATYPFASSGEMIEHAICQTMGEQVASLQLRGVWCRSALGPRVSGTELAWFPATRSSRARPVWRAPLPLGRWRDANTWSDIGLDEQPSP